MCGDARPLTRSGVVVIIPTWVVHRDARWFEEPETFRPERWADGPARADDPAAPGTKVLDNTLIYVMSEVGDGQNHTRTSLIEYPQVPASLPLVSASSPAPPAGPTRSPATASRPGSSHRHAPTQTAAGPGSSAYPAQS